MYNIETDYSNTIIYKITCKDDSIKDVYVGHTTNFVQRKHGHKQSCLNIKCPSYKCKLYEVIRANGGWNNWKMEMINFFNCKDLYEARQKEQEFFISLNATLNSIEPLPRPKDVAKPIIEEKDKNIYFCSTCNVYCNSAKILEDHNKTNKHIKNTTFNNNSEQYNRKFVCNICKVTCTREAEWNRHIITHKHITNMEGNNLKVKVKEYKCCNCNKTFITNGGLWKHNKTCNKYEEKTITIDSLKDDVKNLSDLVMELTKHNMELTKKITDVCNILINNSTPVIV